MEQTDIDIEPSYNEFKLGSVLFLLKFQSHKINSLLTTLSPITNKTINKNMNKH